MATVDLLLQFVDIQTCLLTLTVLFLIHYLFISSGHELPPGPRTWPVIGSVLNFRKYGENIHLYYKDLQKKYGNVYKISFGGHLMIVVNGYDNVKDVLVKQGTFLNRRPAWMYTPNRVLKIEQSKGLVWSEGENWTRLSDVTFRTLCDPGVGEITPEDRIQDELIYLKEVWYQREGESFNPRPDLHRTSLNIIFGIIFGKRFVYDDQVFHQLTDAARILFESQGFLPTLDYLPLLRLLPSCRKKKKLYFKSIRILTDYIVEEIEDHRKSSQDEVRDYIDLFLQNQRQYPDCSLFTDENLRQCIIDLIVSGGERVASTLDFALMYMVKYPDVQHKCQKEIDKNVGVRRGVQIDDCDSLLYTQATIKEVQRMASIGAVGAIRTCPLDTWIGGYRVPRGSLITPNLHSALHDPEYWGDPHIFRPERYITPTRELIHPEALIPYGAGTRMCVGATLANKELFLLFANLVQEFHFSKGDNPDLDLTPVMGVSVNPKPYKLLLHIRR